MACETVTELWVSDISRFYYKDFFLLVRGPEIKYFLHAYIWEPFWNW